MNKSEKQVQKFEKQKSRYLNAVLIIVQKINNYLWIRNINNQWYFLQNLQEKTIFTHVMISFNAILFQSFFRQLHRRLAFGQANGILLSKCQPIWSIAELNLCPVTNENFESWILAFDFSQVKIFCTISQKNYCTELCFYIW